MLYDNMKQVRLGPDEWNPLFLDFANYYGFAPKTHRVRRPRTKGKVERMVTYVRENFLAGRSFAGVEDLNAQRLVWLRETANVRIHSTTGTRPVELWPQEGLTPFASIAPYQIIDTVPRKADMESFVRFDKSRYSVPPRFAGKTLEVGRSGERVIIRLGDMIVADHRAAPTPGSQVAASEHLSELWRLSLDRTPVPPMPDWQLQLEQSVEARPLSVYAGVSA
jgi:hypothetical protein